MTTVASQTRTSTAGFDVGTAGVTPPSKLDRKGVFLVDVVVELGFADQATMDEQVAAGRNSGETIERRLLDSGVVDENQLSLAIAERNGIDHVDLTRFDVDMDAAGLIGRSAASRHGAVPIAFAADGALVVVVKDPFDSLGTSEIEAMTESEVRPVIATAGGIEELIERLPEEALAGSPSSEAPPSEAPRDVQPGDEPSPIVEPEREVELHTEASQPTADVEGVTGDRSDDLRALQEALRQAATIAVKVGRGIEDLESSGERARRLEQELDAAKERIAALEHRLSDIVSAAEDATATSEKLGALQRAVKEHGE